MNRIVVPRIAQLDNSWVDIAKEKYPIGHNNWNYESDVLANFSIGYNEDNIHLKYFVQESNTKAVNTEFNQAVFQDSCVEFFVSFDNANYYNLEFNCIGNILGGYGSGRNNRETITPTILKQIKTKPSLGSNRINIIDRKTEWSLEVIIPKSVFIHDKIDNLNGLKARCNMYKCGDKQAFPHYLSWNPITVEKPDFHLAEFFGEILFEN